MSDPTQPSTPDEPGTPGQPTPPPPAPNDPPPAPADPPPAAPPAAPDVVASGSGAASGGGGGRGKLIAAMVGALVLVVVVTVVLFTVVLGGSGPADAAEDYLQAQVDGEQEDVCNLSSKEYQKQFLEFYEAKDCAEFADKLEDDEDFADFRKFLEDVEADIEIGKVTEDGNKATVKYSEDVEYTGDDEDGFTEAFGQDTKFTEKGTLTMVKEDGDWVVDADETD